MCKSIQRLNTSVQHKRELDLLPNDAVAAHRASELLSAFFRVDNAIDAIICSGSREKVRFKGTFCVFGSFRH